MLSLLLPLLFAALPQSTAVDTNALAVYSYGEQLDVRDALIRRGEMFEDLGGQIVGHYDANLVEFFDLSATVLPEVPEGFTLAVVAHHHHGVDNPARDAGEAIWTSPNGQTMLRILSAAEKGEAASAGFACHGAYADLNTKTAITAQRRTQFSTNALTVAPNIAAAVNQVSATRIEADVVTLVNFGTRRHGQQGEVNAQNWLKTQFENMGYSVSLFDYDFGADVVVAEMRGSVNPEKLVILGAHYDSINYAGSTAPAPGADDDGSGTAGILEVARILAGSDFQNTIQFCAFSGEESGLLGSEAYASYLDNNNIDVIGMVQLDMTAYRANGDTRSVDFITNDTSASLNAFSMSCFEAYVPSLPVKSGPMSGGTSDHRSFFQHGYPAIFPFEDIDQYSPYIHGANDTIGTSANDFVLAELITKGALATIAELAAPPSLTMAHVPLTDTQNETGPYPVIATIAGQTAGIGVAAAELHWQLEGGNWNTSAMVPTSGVDEWSGAIPGQISPARVRYYITATDSNSRENWLPNGFEAGDMTYGFAVGVYQQLAFFDFEAGNDEGWTHAQNATQDDWQRGTPTGQAGDPSGAFSGQNCWGNDLGPSGWNGEYKSDVNNYLASPDIDCSAGTGTHLRFARWLTVEEGAYDQAQIRVNGQVVWENPSSGHTIDTAWFMHDVDISALADGNPAVKLRFQLKSDGGLEFGGWNVDDVELYTLKPVGSGDAIALSGPTQAAAGSSVSYNFTGMSPNADWWLLWSLSNTGTQIAGHDFDLGANWQIAGQGTANGQGAGALQSMLPGAAAGLTVYLEVAAKEPNGAILDSNLLTLSVQ